MRMILVNFLLFLFFVLINRKQFQTTRKKRFFAQNAENSGILSFIRYKKVFFIFHSNFNFTDKQASFQIEAFVTNIAMILPFIFSSFIHLCTKIQINFFARGIVRIVIEKSIKIYFALSPLVFCSFYIEMIKQ